MFYTFDTGKNTYKLRLDSKNAIAVEEQLGVSLLALFGGGDMQDLPTTRKIIIVLHGALQTYNHGISLDDTFSIFDEFIENGGAHTEMYEVLMEVLQVSGFFKVPKTQKETGKVATFEPETK